VEERGSIRFSRSWSYFVPLPLLQKKKNSIDYGDVKPLLKLSSTVSVTVRFPCEVTGESIARVSVRTFICYSHPRKSIDESDSFLLGACFPQHWKGDPRSDVAGWRGSRDTCTPLEPFLLGGFAPEAYKQFGHTLNKILSSPNTFS
jgi:hypothetical protein